MLGTPENGWVEIRIGAFSGWGSFIQDMPVLLLESFTRALSCGLPAEIWIDKEGSRFLIRAHCATEIVAYRGTPETFRFATDLRTLARELLCDLDRDWNFWLTWPLANRTGGMSKSELSDFLNRRAAHLTRLTQALACALETEEIS